MSYSMEERFKSLNVDKVQSVGGMSLIPLISSDTYDDIKGPSGFEFEGTTDYGTMKFRGKEEGLSVIPSNTMVITSDRAQDHAMSTAGILEDSERISFNTACCIESNQGGYMRNSNNEFNILPLTLRSGLGNVRFETGYSKLWDKIEKFNKKVTTNRGAHLEYFFREFRDELEEFTAEFEVVDGQIGALIYYGEDLVGIEISPNVAFWNEIWKWLVRGCYGAEYLRQVKLGREISKIKMPNLEGVKSLTDIKNEVNNYILNGTVSLTNKLSGDVNFVSKKYQTGSKYGKTEMVYVTGNIGSGDVLFVDSKPVYLSLYNDKIGLD